MGKEWDKNDFCTLAPDKIGKTDLSTACYNHDVNHMEAKISRKEADLKLKKDIEELGRPVIAWIYYIFARIFGGFYWKK